jgi:hypothetical protein
MPKLTKLIYGSETDSKKTPFGLLNKQIRTNGIINNAGWFNFKGERLGAGDLSLKDLDKISKNIDSNELFIVLNEADSFWNLPSNLEYTVPGRDYVIQNAIWIVGKIPTKDSLDSASKGKIIRLKKDCINEDIEKDGFKYTRMDKDKVYERFKQSVKPKPVKDKETNSEEVKDSKSGILKKLNGFYNQPVLATKPIPASPIPASPVFGKPIVLIPTNPKTISLPVPTVPKKKVVKKFVPTKSP